MLNMMYVDLISNQKFWVSIKKSIRKSKINPQVVGFINDKRRIVIYQAWLEELLRIISTAAIKSKSPVVIEFFDEFFKSDNIIILRAIWSSGELRILPSTIPEEENFTDIPKLEIDDEKGLQFHVEPPF